MKLPDKTLERIGIGLLLTLGLMTSITPLVRLRGPGGDLTGDGYHVRASIEQLQSMLGVISTVTLSESEDTQTSGNSLPAAPQANSTFEVPYSLKIAGLTPWLLYLALGCAALALIDLATFRKSAATLGLVGGCSAALVVIHTILMGSDLQSWATELLNSGLLNSRDNTILVTRLLVVNSFQVSPGIGLIGLTGCLLLVPFISRTQALPRIRSVVRSEPRVKCSQPVRVRPLHPNYSVETCTSVDLSRSGMCLESSSNHWYVGMEVFVTRNLRNSDATDIEEHGSVVRVLNLANGTSRFAIKIFSPSPEIGITGENVAAPAGKVTHPMEINSDSGSKL